ncbi:hypothetical protein [Catellatospora coxensis]|uniref:Bacteriocin biosynthesis cyclodehydratase domain-containing protein n=1 Tax=Catellatospora coxensis TaxID=310354 RepID=A0A8J3KPR3_9ACTN|nr:hypothetical protein [Catellatospora coxensis]GIG06398.1 hypothetical protein Cco03nite_30980 [Catellatospora coxensis]
MSRLGFPALAAGLAVVDTADGLLIEGGPSRRLFTGAAARDLLPRLLPLLDGRTGLAAVADAAEAPVAQVAQAVALLHRSGLLHDGPAEPGDAAEAFRSRALAASGSHDRPATLRERLAEAPVIVAVAGELGELLAADLALSGIGTVTTDATRAAALAIATDDQLASVAATGVPVLRIGGDARTVELGPLFTGAETTCPDCFLADDGSAGAPVLGRAAAQLLCGLAVAEAVGLLTRLADPVTGRRLHRIDTVDLGRTVHEVTPSATCRTCAMAGDGVLGRLEWLNRRASWQVTGDRAIAATADADLASSPRVPLSEAPPWLRTLLPAATARPYADTYLLGVHGLPHPVYRWSPSTQALIATRGDLTAAPAIAGLPEAPAAVLVFVAASTRLASAYAEQGLRRAFLAAGRAVAAVTAGHHAVLADTVDPALADLLELHDGGEHLAAVVGIHPERP